MARHATAGRIDATRLGVRRAVTTDPTGALAPETADEFAADGLASGVRRIGDARIAIERVDHGDGAVFELRLGNAGDTPMRVESVVLGFEWSGVDTAALRFLRHGWQSWSFTGVVDLDDRGTPEFPSGEWLRGMHHGVGRPPADRAGWHESDAVSVAGAGDGPACLAGVLETGLDFGLVYWRRAADRSSVLCEVELRIEVILDPGEERRLDAVRVALGSDAQRLIERFATLWGARAGARTGAPFQAGWCSWYHFFHGVTESDILRNLEALARERDAIPVSVVQLDDGYQRAIGDWLETNEKFPRGLEPLAADIRSAGFEAGIWTAPFCAVTESRIHEDHRDWLLRDGDEVFNGLIHPEWSPQARVFALDTTHPEVIAHLEQTYARLAGMGFHYQKLDFLHSAAMRADATDPRVSRAERLARGLEAVRRGAGDDAFLLGCGCPIGPAVGRVDAMRIGPDVAPTWGIQPPVAIPGLEPALPSTESAVRSILDRAWMHRRLWLNDPDCLMARQRDTELTPAEIRTLAAAIAVTGGMLIFSDDVGHLDESGRRCIRETERWSRAVDGAAARGVARLAGWLGSDSVRNVVASKGRDALVATMNPADRVVQSRVDLAELGLAPTPEKVEGLLDSPARTVRDGALHGELDVHEAGLYRVTAAHSLAVFCDFDGTFSIQDVGATIAREQLPEKRADLWARYEKGGLTPWTYNIELFDGFEWPREELLAFLRTIELDPGAERMLAWCREGSVPFRILSDGFDLNLDYLQEHHGVRFEYAANRLRYEGDLWRLEAGAPDDACDCGTGICKRRQIADWRDAHPGTLCVHIGNGRVSDLCGAVEADWTFAKDSLADAMDERGIEYDRFETLDDVVEALAASLEPLQG